MLNKNYNIKEVPIELIKTNPNQPRQLFDDDMINDLAKSINKYGLMQPISIRKVDNKNFELIAGERRLRAAKISGLKKIPAIINQVDNKDSAVLALVENIQRENLNYLEESEAYRKLIDFYGYKQQEVADSVGKSQSTIANKLRLLNLSEKVRLEINNNKLTERHARSLLKVKNEKDQLKIINEIVTNSLNVKQTEELIFKILNQEKDGKTHKRKKTKKFIKDKRIIDNTIKQTLQIIEKGTGLDVKCNMKEINDTYEINIRIPFK